MASLSDRFNAAVADRAEGRAPGTLGGAVSEYGWSTRDIAQQFGVSERTARRWRQQDRVPARRAEDFRKAARDAATGRQRARIERRGIGKMTVTGHFTVGGKYPRRIPPAVPAVTQARIPAAAMREYFGALDAGDAAGADDILNGAWAEAYGIGADVSFDDAESLGFTV